MAQLRPAVSYTNDLLPEKKLRLLQDCSDRYPSSDLQGEPARR